ncbi:MAG: L-ribulose-5-phosphate 3-epimerase [Sphaerochaetaceae bacterium]
MRLTRIGGEQMYRLGLYEKAIPNNIPFKEKLAIAGESGYDYLEISIDESEEKLRRLKWSVGQLRQLVKATWDCGVPIGSMCLSGHRKFPLGEENPRSMEIMKEAIRFAGFCGIPLIQLAGYDTYYHQSTEETRKRFLQNLFKATSMAATEGVLLGFETMETDFMDTVGKAMKFVSSVSSPFLGVYPDIGNLTNASLEYGDPVGVDLERGKGHIFAVHIKETLPGHYREVPFGKGDVDFPRILRACWDLGIRRYVTEFWYTGAEDWRKTVSETSGFARKILDSFSIT